MDRSAEGGRDAPRAAQGACGTPRRWTYRLVGAALCVAGGAAAASDVGIVESLSRGHDTAAQAAAARSVATAPAERMPAPASSALAEVSTAAKGLSEALRTKAAPERSSEAILALKAAMLLAEGEFEAIETRLRALRRADLDAALQRLEAARQRWQVGRHALDAALTAMAAKQRGSEDALLAVLDAATVEERAARNFGVSPPVLRPRFEPRGLRAGSLLTPSYARPQLEPALVEDREAGAEAVLSVAVRNHAASLGNDYIALADFVRSAVRTEWRAGSAQSVDETLRRGAGNDIEQASLLIALLRASGAAARYVTGVVEVPLEQLATQMGVPERRVGAALAAAGIAHEPVVLAGRISGFRFEHVWVSALVPYGNYRGSMADDGNPMWLPLMPALKPAQFEPGTPVASVLDVQAVAWIDAWLGASRSELPWGALRSQLSSALAGLQPPLDLAALAGQHEPDAPPIGLLPASTPHRVVAVHHESAELLDEQRVWLQVRVIDAGGAGAALLDGRIALSGLAALRFTLAYLPATVEDQHLANLRGGFGGFPAYLVRLRPTLLAGGQPVLAGEGVAEAGAVHRLQLSLQGPAGELSAVQPVLAGTLASWSLDVAGAAPRPDADERVDSDTPAGRLLGRFAERYLAEWARDEGEIAAAFGLRVLRPLPALALALPQYVSEGAFGLVDRFDFQGVALDAALRPLEPVSLRGESADESDFLRISALHGSALESSLFEQQWAVQALSADRALQRATAAGVPMLELEPFASAQDLAAHAPALRQRVQDWLDAGYRVRIPRDPLVVEAWRGAAWRIEHPDTGESGYFLTGDYAGGVTVIPPGLWYFRALAATLADPYAPTPNRDPLAAVLVALDVESQNQFARAGEWFERPLRVYVSDRDGLPVEGAAVRFAIVLGAGRFEPSQGESTGVTVLSDHRGLAEVRMRAPDRGAGLPRTLMRLPGDTHPQRVYTARIDVEVATREGALLPGTTFSTRMVAGDPVRLELEPIGLDASERDNFVIGPGVGEVPYRLRALDAFGNPVANHAVTVRVADRYTGPECSANFDLPGSSVFLKNDCPTELLLLAGHPCTAAYKSTLTAHDGIEFNVVPSSIFHTRVTVEASSSLGSEFHRFDTYRAQLQVDDEDRCRHPRLVTILGSSRDDRHEIAALGQRVAHGRIVQALISGTAEVGVVGAEWAPTDVDGFRLRANRASVVNLRQEAVGTYRFEVEAATTPGRIHLEAAGQIEGVSLLATLPPAWAVDLRAPEIEPAVLDLDAFQAITHPLRIRVPMLPPQYRAEDMRVEILDDLGDIHSSCYFPEGGDQSTCHVNRGRRFSEHRSFHARYIVNPSDSAPLISAETPLRLDRDILVGFGALAAGETPPDLMQFVARRYPIDLMLNTEIDPQSDYLCKTGARFVHALGRAATVDLRFFSLDQGGQPGWVVWHPIAAQQQPAGVYELPVSLDDLDIGVYRYELRVEAEGRIETRVGRLRHKERRRDALPLSRSFVKGVDLHDGHAVESVEDASVAGRGPGLRFTRTYSSTAGDRLTLLGMGWSSDIESEVTVDDCGTFVVNGAAGQGQRYVADGVDAEGQPRFRSPNGFHGTLRRQPGGFDFYAKDGTRYHFAERVGGATRLSLVEDPNGNRVHYEYESLFGHRVVRRMRDDAGRALNFEYATQALQPQPGDAASSEYRLLLRKLTGPEGLVVEYRYDSDGNLSEVERKDEGPGRRVDGYRYSDLGTPWLTAPDGVSAHHHFGFRLVRIRNEIDGSERRLDWQLGWTSRPDGIGGFKDIPEQRVQALTEPDLGVTRFVYHGLRGRSDSSTEVADARGHRSTYTLNRHGAAIRVETPAGTSLTEWNLVHLQPASTTDPLGTVTRYTYDEHGNVVQARVEHANGTLSRSWEFVAPEHFAVPIKNRARSATDARGIQTQWGYDTRGNRTGQARGGVSESWSYATNGDLLSHTDGTGARTQSEHDAFGHRTRESDALGARWTRRYDARSRLVMEADGRGNQTEHRYDALDRRILTRFPPVGDQRAERSTAYDDSARTRTETDELGRQTVHSFDAMGRERAVRNAAQDVRERTWDANGNLLSETDFRGNLTRYEYDAANRRVRQVGPGDRRASFTHDALGNLLSEEVSHADGSQIRRSEYRYAHPLNLPTSVRQQQDAGTWTETVTAYDANGNPERLIDANGGETFRTYDARDRLTEERAPEGRTVTYRYDGADRRIRESLNTTPEQVRTREFDVRGRETLYRDASGGEWRQAYDLSNKPVRKTDPRAQGWSYDYDARNRLIAESGPIEGLVSTFGYDAVGNRTGEHTADGRELEHGYDELNRRVHSSDQLGPVESLSYDADGHPLTRIDAEGRVTLSVWNALGQETQRRLPPVPAGERVLGFVYSVHGELLAETDANGQVTTHRYDGLGRRIATLLPDGKERSATYDAVGNLLTATDAEGFTTTYRYDGLNRRIGQDDPAPLGTTQSWSHDAAGNVLTHADRRGVVTRSTYDGENRVIELRRDGVRRQTLVYDAAGNLISETDANGEETTHTYDAGNRRVLTARPLQYRERWTFTPWGGLASSTDADGFVTTHRYDVRQRLIATTDPAGEETAFGYDGVGNRVRIRRPGNAEWLYAFDAGDRLVTVRSPERATTAYGYDRHGNRITQTDAEDQTTTWTFDARHRVEQVRHPDRNTEHFSYDGEGRLVGRIDGNGARTDSDYDALGRLLERRYSGARDEDIATERWVYDGNGNVVRIEQVGADGRRHVTEREWDRQERLHSETDRFGQQTTNSYDAEGNRLRREDPHGITEYTLDRLHRTVQLRPRPDPAIRLVWSPHGRLLGIEHPNGATQQVELDEGGRIAAIVHRQGSVTVAQHTYAYDRRGNRERESIEDGFGRSALSYRYDGDDRLTGVDHEGGHADREEDYTLDAVGNRLTQRVREGGALVESVAFEYGPRQRLEQRRDLIAGVTTTYRYDGNGALIEETTAGATTGYRQNPQERLATLTLPGAPPIHYAYDSEGRRVEKRSPSEARRFGWDGSQLRRETNVTHNPLATHEWHAGRVLRSQTPTHTRYAQHDALRSPTRWSLNDGTEHSRRRYGAWGEDRARQGEVPEIGYTGHYLDSESSDYYAQQRYYRAGVGRFTRVDPWVGDTNNPITLNKYLYANGNPLIYVDPDGRAGTLLNAFAPEMAYAVAMASSDAEQSLNLRAQANQQPTFALAVGTMLTGAKLSVGAVQLADDIGSDDADAQARMAQRWAALRDQGEEVLPYAIRGPAGLAEYYGRDLASRVREDAAGLYAAIQQKDFVGVAESGTALTGDLSEVSGVTAAVRGGLRQGLRGLSNAERVVVVEGRDGNVTAVQSPGELQTLSMQRSLANVTTETRDAFLKDPQLLARYLRSGEIDRIQKESWRMRLFFGTAVERRVAEIAAESDDLRGLVHTRSNAPQDFVGPDGYGYDITGSSESSILGHAARKEVDAVVTYDSIPNEFGREWVKKYFEDD